MNTIIKSPVCVCGCMGGCVYECGWVCVYRSECVAHQYKLHSLVNYHIIIRNSVNSVNSKQNYEAFIPSKQMKRW